MVAAQFFFFFFISEGKGRASSHEEEAAPERGPERRKDLFGNALCSDVPQRAKILQKD
jgi:hypothetical protein